MNSKETLKKLHKRFPLMSLDELFDILDCYVETPSPWWDKAYCTTATSDSISKVAPAKCVTTKVNYSDGAVSNINTTGNIELAAGHYVCRKQ